MRIYESTKMTLIFDRMESLERKQKKSAIRKCMSQDFKLCVWTAVSFWYFWTMTLTWLFFFQIGFFWFSYIASVFHKYSYET